MSQRFTRKAGHHLVDDDEVERFALMKGPLEFRDSCETIVDRDCLDAKAGQLTRQNAPVHLDVVDNQDSKTCQFAGQGPAFDGRVDRRLQRQLKPEAAAEAQRAVDADLAAHQLDQLLAYAQPETASAKA